MKRLIDLSQTIEDNQPVFPGDVKTSLFQTKYLNTNNYNDYRLEIGMHSGTHVDGPMHLTESPEFISVIPPESFIARGCLLDVRNQSPIRLITEYEQLVPEDSIVLLCTGQDRLYGSPRYFKDYPVVGLDLCKFLLKKKIKMLGMDAPSPDRYPYEVHKFLLSHGIYITENLTNLDKLVGANSFEVVALPLKIKSDSSMARVLARVDV
jgi:kynurenine formamidase